MRRSVPAGRSASYRLRYQRVKLDDLAMLPGVETRLLDVMDLTDIQKSSDEIGVLDVLFNCAGYVHHGTILECDEDAWDFSFDLNVKAQYRMIRAFLPSMLAAGGGSNNKYVLGLL